MEIEPTTAYGLVALIISNIGIWIREIVKHKTWKGQNGNVTEIKKSVASIETDVRAIDKKVGGIEKNLASVNTEIKGFGRTCTRLDGEIKVNRDDIKSLIGGKTNRNK